MEKSAGSSSEVGGPTKASQISSIKYLCANSNHTETDKPCSHNSTNHTTHDTTVVFIFLSLESCTLEPLSKPRSLQDTLFLLFTVKSPNLVLFQLFLKDNKFICFRKQTQSSPPIISLRWSRQLGRTQYDLVLICFELWIWLLWCLIYSKN